MICFDPEDDKRLWRDIEQAFEIYETNSRERIRAGAQAIGDYKWSISAKIEKSLDEAGKSVEVISSAAAKTVSRYLEQSAKDRARIAELEAEIAALTIIDRDQFLDGRG